MTMPLKPRVAKTICRIDRKTVAVTANVAFEDIDLRINGEGSEVYDYEYIFKKKQSGNFILDQPCLIYTKTDEEGNVILPKYIIRQCRFLI